MSRTHLAFLSIILTNCVAFEEKDMICSDDFCTRYVEEKGCPKLSEACLVQNATHNGVFLPYPDVCNCCDYCITNLALDDICTLGSPGLPPPLEICGPGLACTYKKGSPSTCQPMKTTCTNAQTAWDDRRAKGELGMTEVRPKCDEDGIFAPPHCIPGSICYCVATDGKRIFGEIPFLNPSDEHKMTCECSLNHWKALRSVNPDYVDEMLTARCNDHGLYDPLQCMMGPEANCVCVDPINGEPKIDEPPVRLSELKPGKPTCFDPLIHVAHKYASECEILKLKWHEWQSSTTTIASLRTSQFEHPECQPDGKYHRVQTQETNRICVDPSGQQIDKYQAPIDSPEGNFMDCNCARTFWLLKTASVVELPSCCGDGSFEAWQCRREECFCVDCNGDQIGVEVNIDDLAKLSCYNDNNPCPTPTTQCS